MNDYKKVAELMADFFMGSQDAECLLCDNHMKNIPIKKSNNQGCDGSCRHDREYTKEDLLSLFVKEAEGTE